MSRINKWQFKKLMGEQTIQEAKKIFKSLALLLHPDISKTTQSNDDFIELKKIYDQVIYELENPDDPMFIPRGKDIRSIIYVDANDSHVYDLEINLCRRIRDEYKSEMIEVNNLIPGPNIIYNYGHNPHGRPGDLILFIIEEYNKDE